MRLLATWLVLLGFATQTLAAEPPKLGLRKGDHVCIIGNTLADRMQHDGWLETLLQARVPRHELVIRDLGFSGDELTLRLRSEAFGSPDTWLTFCKADVIFAFFGYNESFQGQAGLDKFKKDLDSFIKHTVTQKYNGQSPPRLVLFSPIAHEDLKDRNLPDGKGNNRRLETYTAAMADVAKANNVPFVDLFHPSQDLYAKTNEPLTINGIHLNDYGNEQIARAIDRALFPNEAEPSRDPQSFAKLRAAVQDKCFTWFERYRTVDGYSIYGGRADLKFVDGQTNREVMQREMQVLDAMTANRDQHVWAVAKGENGPNVADLDSKTAPFIPVITNKPGPLPGGKHLFLDGQDAISKMRLGKNLKVNLFCSEKTFPEMVNPVQMSFDPTGRLWVAVWPTYPHWKPKEEMNDKILILEDTDGDGMADKCTVFADHLHCPTGFDFYNGGIIVAQAPDLMFLKDTDGDDKADVRVRVLHGLDSADTHHTSNSFVLDPGGALYFQEGTFHHTQVETPYGPPERCANAGVFRYEPRTQKFDVYVSFGFANPHGHAFNSWGQDIVVDGTGSNPYDAVLFSGHVQFPQKHNRPPQVYQQRTRPCPGMEYLSSRHFPEDMQGNLLVGNVIGDQGILRYKITEQGASFVGTELEPILMSSDPNFRPTDFKVGPDGAIYFLDWHNPIIGHMQHNLRDPSRDRDHGRVYRVTYEGRPLLKPVKIAGEPIEKLLDALKESEDRVRYRTRIELGGRKTDDVIAATKKWVAALDKSDPNYEHNVLEGLWLHQNHNVVNAELLQQVLKSKDHRARAAAVRVVLAWRDRLANALEMLKGLAADPHPRVRIEAIRAASFFPTADAIEVPLISADHPSDQYLEFARNETMRTLEPYWKKALADGKQISFSSEAGARYLYKSMNTEDLLRLKPSRALYAELVTRKGVRDEQRTDAIAGLARFDNKSELRTLLDTLSAIDNGKIETDESITFDLVRILSSRSPKELATARGDLEKLALNGKKPVTRQLGFVALVAADGSAEMAWSRATQSSTALRDLITAMPLLRDPNQRAALYPKIEPLLRGLPPELTSKTTDKGVRGRYVRIELPGPQRTLTLAEVEVYSDGRNVARLGKAKQINTAHGGDANKAIDGMKSGAYGDGGQTHTQEGIKDPWWEVDLGGEYPIDGITIYNRTEGNLGSRLKNYTVKVLDGSHAMVFQKTNLPTPEVKAEIPVGGEAPEQAIRRAAMLALPSVRGQETAAFKALARFIASNADRATAIQAIQRIPAAHWPAEEVKPVLDGILGYVRKLPTTERTSAEALDALQLGENLAATLPVDEARKVRKELGELGVRILRMATVPDLMLFDKERLVVQAGKTFEILFENNDIMPHNLVITQPGALEEIGTTSELQATQPGAMERGYVPQSPKVLIATRLLQPREAQKMAWTAPTKPGIYPIVCTYPGHWRRMYAALYVVEDLETYLADPEAYVGSHPMPIADELLKYNRPRKEWKLEELASAVEKMSGRSYNHGKQLFSVAACVSCHKLNNVGQEFGPDLTKLDPKWKPLDVLREILDPSLKIDDKFKSHVIQTDVGQVITGMILEETPTEIKLIENPLLKAQPIVIKKSDIAARKTSPTSIMPKNLLDKFTAEEILDLLAYVVAAGNEKHVLFKGGEHGH